MKRYSKEEIKKMVAEWDFNGNALDVFNQLLSDNEEMEKALIVIFERYLSLANSGDAGFWDPEDEDEVKLARTTLQKLRGES